MHTRSTLSECPASVARSSKNYHTYATRAHVQCAEKMIRIAQCVQVHARARTRMMCNVKVVLARQLREIDARASLYIYKTRLLREYALGCNVARVPRCYAYGYRNFIAFHALHLVTESMRASVNLLPRAPLKYSFLYVCRYISGRVKSASSV